MIMQSGKFRNENIASNRDSGKFTAPFGSSNSSTYQNAYKTEKGGSVELLLTHSLPNKQPNSI